MSRIDALIRQLAPSGVAHKSLRAVCTDFIVPMRDRPKIFDGDIPWCRIEDIEGLDIHTSRSGFFVSERVVREMNLKVMPVGTVIASCSASLGRYAITSRSLVMNQTFIGLVCGPELYNRYLLHVMQTKTNELASVSNTATIPYISRRKFEELVIPVPPLEVQHAIVGVLDAFVSLEAELEAELEARRVQYEHFRDSLVTFSGRADVRWMELGEAADVRVGQAPAGRLVDVSAFPYVNAGTTASGWASEANTKAGAITIPSRGQGGVGVVAYQATDFWCGPLCYRIRSNRPGLSTKYLFYYLKSIQASIRSLQQAGGTPALNRKELVLVRVPAPSIAEQERIVAILDKFDALVNDLSIGLPAELNARRKQYEHYRDRLLTFQEAA